MLKSIFQEKAKDLLQNGWNPSLEQLTVKNYLQSKSRNLTNYFCNVCSGHSNFQYFINYLME